MVMATYWATSDVINKYMANILNIKTFSTVILELNVCLEPALVKNAVRGAQRRQLMSHVLNSCSWFTRRKDVAETSKDLQIQSDARQMAPRSTRR